MKTVERIAQTIRRNPESLLLLGAGVTLMLRNVTTFSAPSRPRATRPNQSSSDHNDRIRSGGAVGSANESLAGKVSATADDVRSYVADTAQDLTDKAAEYGQAATRRTKQVADSAYRSAEEIFEAHPMSMMIGGLAAGCLAAAAFPSTRFERDTLGPIGRRAAEAISETGQLVKSAAEERVASPAMKASEQLKGAVTPGQGGVQTKLGAGYTKRDGAP
jgi:hypothetical protein